MPLLSFLENGYWLYSAYFKQKARVFFQIIRYYYCMIDDITSLPKQVQTFFLDQQNIIADQQEKIAHQQKTIDQIREQYQQLQHQMHCFLRHRFGKKSEQGIPGQGNLFDPDATLALNDSGTTPNDVTQEAATHSSKEKSKRSLRQLPADLPRKRIEYDLSEQQKHCNCGCGRRLKKIGEEVLEQLEIIPAQVYIIEHVRFKYAGCAYDSLVVTADMPRQPIDKSMAGPGL